MAQQGVSINDAVHRTINLPAECVAVIDTLEFQRLRALKQCGVCHLVYPSATHSRFEHSIGVFHWAQEFLGHCEKHIKLYYKNPDASLLLPENKKLCVLLAGLCHDLGHGPFSHLWEHFLKRLGIKWRHETGSQDMFRFLYNNNENVKKIFDDHGLTNDDVDLICHLIAGDIQKGEHPFLFEIIANKINGVDVDKFEYVMRDATQFGLPFFLDITRILDNVGIVSVSDDGSEVPGYHVAYRDKIADSFEELYMCRGHLHKKCCQHKTCKAVQLMLIDALVAANDHFQISWEEPTVSGDGQRITSCKLSECHKNMNALLRATDTIFYDLLYSTSHELSKSRTLLERMMKRDLYILFFKKPHRLEDENKRESMEKCMVGKLENELGKHGEFRSSWVDVTYGRKCLPKIKYFTKENPRKPSARPLQEDIRKNFHELLIFWTKGKKSLTSDEKKELENMKKSAENIYETLLPQFKCGPSPEVRA